MNDDDAPTIIKATLVIILSIIIGYTLFGYVLRALELC